MGRPKSFCREEVLDLAIELFRRHGYKGTSMQDLIDAMGINRFSLYEEFGDKSQLFLEAFDLYVARKREQFSQLFCVPGPRIPVIRRYFEMIVDEALSMPVTGCLLISSAVELVNEQPLIADRAREQFTAMEGLMYRELVVAQRSGEIGADRNLHALSRFLISNVRGIRLTARVTPIEGVLMDIVDVTLSILDENT